MRYIDNEAHIFIIQETQHRWRIETRGGFILQGDIFLDSNSQAEDYIKNYLSSYLCWSHEVIPLVNKKKEGAK